MFSFNSVNKIFGRSWKYYVYTVDIHWFLNDSNNLIKNYTFAVLIYDIGDSYALKGIYLRKDSRTRSVVGGGSKAPTARLTRGSCWRWRGKTPRLFCVENLKVIFTKKLIRSWEEIIQLWHIVKSYSYYLEPRNFVKCQDETRRVYYLFLTIIRIKDILLFLYFFQLAYLRTSHYNLVIFCAPFSSSA